jgi:hypothetical protein
MTTMSFLLDPDPIPPSGASNRVSPSRRRFGFTGDVKSLPSTGGSNLVQVLSLTCSSAFKFILIWGHIHNTNFSVKNKWVQ